jgi:alpha-ketoglutarate-dependent 2,4-dichlorophenoxyacetate dioxygenase
LPQNQDCARRQTIDWPDGRIDTRGSPDCGKSGFAVGFVYENPEESPMEIVPVGPGFGVELRGVTLADVVADDAVYAATRSAFEEHSVLVLRDQEVSDELQLAFSRRFGPPEVTKVGSQGTGTHFVILSTIGADGNVVPPDHRMQLRNKANQLWHTDSSFKRVPALTSILSARIIPDHGGETEFVSTRLAFERLDSLRQQQLEALFVWHDYAYSRGKITPDLASTEERAALPPQCWRMVWRNPVNGRGALYLASHAYAVEGMEREAGRKLIDELTAAAIAPGASYLHQWRKGDVVMWDNRATMHRGRPWPSHEPRLMIRTTISATKADGLASICPPSWQAAE